MVGAADLTRTLAKGLFASADLTRRSSPGPRLLIYHQVGAAHRAQLNLSTAAFGRQLDWLRRAGKMVTLDNALGRLGDPTASDWFVLTFDDGYCDMFENALPLLVERELPFVIYITTRSVEERLALARGRDGEPLSWDQLSRMVATGLATVGAHTHRHLDLRRVSAAEVENELEVANDLIEQRTGERPRHFAYPYGYWSSSADGPVRRIYVSAALGGASSGNPDRDPHRLHRIPIQRADSMPFFIAKARRGQRTEEGLRRLIRGYRGP